MPEGKKIMPEGKKIMPEGKKIMLLLLDGVCNHFSRGKNNYALYCRPGMYNLNYAMLDLLRAHTIMLDVV